MNIAVIAQNLLKALKTLSVDISTSTNPPILRYALLRTNSAVSCEIVGTDLETTQIVEVPCKVEREFSCLVNYDTILHVVNLMIPKERIDIRFNEQDSLLHITQGNNRNRLKLSSNVQDFPAVPSMDDAEVIATISDVRAFKDQVTHVARFCTQPRKNYATRATEFLRLDILGNALTICGASTFAASEVTIEADVQADADLTVFVPSRAFLKALGAMASDNSAESRVSRGRRFGGVPFDILWLDREKTLALRNPTRTILIRVEDKLSFEPPEYQIVAQVPILERGTLASLFKVAKRTHAGSLHIRITESDCVEFEAAGVTVRCESGDWESPYGDSLNVSATLELKGSEAIAVLEYAMSFRRNPKGTDFDMIVFLAQRENGDWLLGLTSETGVEDVIILENANITWSYEEEMAR